MIDSLMYAGLAPLSLKLQFCATWALNDTGRDEHRMASNQSVAVRGLSQGLVFHQRAESGRPASHEILGRPFVPVSLLDPKLQNLCRNGEDSMEGVEGSKPARPGRSTCGFVTVQSHELCLLSGMRARARAQFSRSAPTLPEQLGQTRLALTTAPDPFPCLLVL